MLNKLKSQYIHNIDCKYLKYLKSMNEKHEVNISYLLNSMPV